MAVTEQEHNSLPFLKDTTSEEVTSLTQPSKLTRRKFLKILRNLSLLGIGAVTGFEASNLLQIPEKIISLALLHEINQ